MNVVESFLSKREGRFNLRAFLNTFFTLMAMKSRNGGSVQIQEIKNMLQASNNLFSFDELEAHTAILIECALQPVLGMDGQIRLQLREELSNEELFIQAMLTALNFKCGHGYSPIIENFKYSIKVYFNSTGKDTSNCTSKFGNSMKMSFSEQVGVDITPQSSIYPQMRQFASTQTALQQQQQRVQSLSLQHTKSIEQSEPIVRFLAQVRKQGMDILFPQDAHDKILAAIFVAVQATESPAHRELIDMVMAVRDCGSVCNLEGVSKTKIRGLLALLKHGEMLETTGLEGQPVQLKLADGIKSFAGLRDRHDAYLTKFAGEWRLSVPHDLWGEIVWKRMGDRREARLQAMSDFVESMKSFYMGNTWTDPQQQHSMSSVAPSSMHMACSYSSSSTTARRYAGCGSIDCSTNSPVDYYSSQQQVVNTPPAVSAATSTDTWSRESTPSRTNPNPNPSILENSRQFSLSSTSAEYVPPQFQSTRLSANFAAYDPMMLPMCPPTAPRNITTPKVKFWQSPAPSPSKASILSAAMSHYTSPSSPGPSDGFTRKLNYAAKFRGVLTAEGHLEKLRELTSPVSELVSPVPGASAPSTLNPLLFSGHFYNSLVAQETHEKSRVQQSPMWSSSGLSGGDQAVNWSASRCHEESTAEWESALSFSTACGGDGRIESMVDSILSTPLSKHKKPGELLFQSVVEQHEA